MGGTRPTFGSRESKASYFGGLWFHPLHDMCSPGSGEDRQQPGGAGAGCASVGPSRAGAKSQAAFRARRTSGCRDMRVGAMSPIPAQGPALLSPHVGAPGGGAGSAAAWMQGWFPGAAARKHAGQQVSCNAQLGSGSSEGSSSSARTWARRKPHSPGRAGCTKHSSSCTARSDMQGSSGPVPSSQPAGKQWGLSSMQQHTQKQPHTSTSSRLNALPCSQNMRGTQGQRGAAEPQLARCAPHASACSCSLHTGAPGTVWCCQTHPCQPARRVPWPWQCCWWHGDIAISLPVRPAWAQQVLQCSPLTAFRPKRGRNRDPEL